MPLSHRAKADEEITVRHRSGDMLTIRVYQRSQSARDLDVAFIDPRRLFEVVRPLKPRKPTLEQLEER